MAEYLREVVVTIHVDTNKQTHEAKITLQEDEGLEAFSKRLVTTLLELTAKWVAIFDALCAGIHAVARGEELPEVAAAKPKAPHRKMSTP